MPHMAAVVGAAETYRTKNMQMITDTYHALQKPGLLVGQLRSYRPFADGEEHQRPEENKRVEYTVDEMVRKTRFLWTEMWDAVATRDWANAGAGAPKADVVLDGEVLIEDAPVPFLLWLSKELDKIEAFVRKFPVHSQDAEWDLIEDRGVWAATPVHANLTVNEQVPRVIVPPTDKHPAQVAAIQETVTKGIWTTQALSGGIPVNARAEMLRRVIRLKEAVSSAKDQANRIDVPRVQVADRVVEYIFG